MSTEKQGQKRITTKNDTQAAEDLKQAVGVLKRASKKVTIQETIRETTGNHGRPRETAEDHENPRETTSQLRILEPANLACVIRIEH